MQKNVLLTLMLALLIPSVVFGQGKRRAVVVGVAGFDHGYASLDYTARDARRTASALEDLGYSVSLLAADADAGKVEYADVLKALRSGRSCSQSGDTLLFFFAGHGSRRMDKDYLLLSDSDPDKFDSTALALDTLSDIVAASKATRRVFVIDACRSTSRADGKTGFTGGKLDKGFKDALDKLTEKSAPNTDIQSAVLYACSPGETSKENIEERAGVFTNRFVHALQQPDSAMPLTLGGILSYVRSHMPATVEQNPLLVGPDTLQIGPPGQRTASDVERPSLPNNTGNTTRSRLKVNPTDGAEMVHVSGGSFTMGDTDRSDTPQRQVTLSGYYIYRTPVTVAQYKRFCAATAYPMPAQPSWGWKDDHPMVNVTWDEAQAYCKWAGVRLPTEAEWEMAARGTDGRYFPWGNTFDSSKLQCSKSQVGDAGSTAPVGNYPSGASPCGALDMEGNVRQWCVDWSDIGGLEFGKLRSVRGGSWDSVDTYLFRTSLRNNGPPAARYPTYGFRCVSAE